MHESAPPSRGNAPRPAPRMFVKPTVRLINLDPKLAMEQTLLVNTPVPSIQPPLIGDPNGVLGLLSARDRAAEAVSAPAMDRGSGGQGTELWTRTGRSRQRR